MSKMSQMFSEDAIQSLYSLYSGGQFKSWSIPVAEARAVVGVPHPIESDEGEEEDHNNATSSKPIKRTRAETASTIMIRKKKSSAQVALDADSSNTKVRIINSLTYHSS
jgi:hypothetical protein